MKNAQDGGRPRRSRSRRATFAATALLAGCSTVARDAVEVMPLAPATVPGGFSVIIARVTAPALASVGMRLLDSAELWNVDTGENLAPGIARPSQYAFSTTPSRTAGLAGWATRMVPAGHYFLRLRAAGAAAEGGQRDFTFTIPETPGTFFIGTFNVDCAAPSAPGPAAGCRIGAAPKDETVAATAVLAAENPAADVPVRRLARPYPQRLARLGLEAPIAPTIRVDGRQWLAAINWNAVAAPAASGGSQTGDHPTIVYVVGFIFLSPIIVPLLPIGLINLAVQDARERSEAERIQATQEVTRVQSAPCEATIAEALAPEAVERHLQSVFANGRHSARRGMLSERWEAAITRLVFRQCASAPTHFAVEVGTRWTMQRTNETEPGFDVAYARSVAGAVADPRLRFSTPPPWEQATATQAACRPLATYCGAAGSALLLEEVVQGVTEARDAIAARR